MRGSEVALSLRPMIPRQLFMQPELPWESRGKASPRDAMV
jgi:hypothetical protein